MMSRIILIRWILAILRGDKDAARMYRNMPKGTPEF
jgi:hypothetical protein